MKSKKSMYSGFRGKFVEASFKGFSPGGPIESSSCKEPRTYHG